MEQQQIDTYLSSLRQELGPMSLGEREEVLREISAHVRDAVEQSGAPTADVLQRLGSPHALAAEYRDGLIVRHARRSLSPLLLVRASLRLASKGMVGVLVFFCAVFGYGMGVGEILTAFAKLISPAHTGMWVLDGHLVFLGCHLSPPPPPAHEILGWWYIPLALVMGSLFVSVTSFAIRTCLRAGRQLGARLAQTQSALTAR